MPGIVVPPALSGPSLNLDQTWTGNEAFSGRLAISSGYPWADVRAFGAVGDGVADDTAAFLAAIAKVPASGGILGIVFVPPGLYKITSSLALGTNKLMLGAGYATTSGSGSRGASCLLKTGNFDCLSLDNGSQVSNLQVDGAGGNGGDGIYMVGGRNLLQNVAVTSQGGVGVRIGGKTIGINTNVWRVFNLVTVANTSHGLLVSDFASGAGTPNVNAGQLYGLDSRANGGDGLRVDHAIDNQYFGVMCASNTGWGIHLVNGASGPSHGQEFIFPYLEANTAGTGTIDNGCTQNVVWGTRYNPGVSDGWVDNNTNNSNLILGRSPGPNWVMKSILGFAATSNPQVYFDNPTAGSQVLQEFRDAGSVMWQLGKDTNNSFFWWDQTGNRYAVVMTSNGALRLMPGSGLTQVGASGTAVALEVLGGLQFDKDLRRSSQSPSFATPYTPDPTLGEMVRMTLTGALTVNAPGASVAGQHLRFYWTQDGTGGRVVTYNAVYKTGGAVAFSTTLNTVTIDDFECVDGTNWRLVSRITGQT